MKAVDSHVGSRLGQKRSQERLTVATLAYRLGVGQADLLRYENGQERIPAHIVTRLCSVFCVSPSYFFHPEFDESADGGPNGAPVGVAPPAPAQTGPHERPSGGSRC
jgi:transcriptional regulator with XRE-family HTH domain